MQAYNHTTDSNRLSVLGLPTSLDHEANKNLKQTLERISANENTTHTNEESSKLVTTYCGDWLEMVAQTKHKVTVEVAGASDHLEGVSVDLFHQSSEIWDVHNATQNNVLAHISKTCERIEKKNAPYDPITTVISDPDAADVRDSADCFYDSGATSLSLLLNPRFDVVSRSGDAATDEEQDKSEGNKKGENEKSNDDDDEADDDADVVDNTDHILNLESGALNTNELSGDDRLDMFRELLDMFNWEREDNQIEFHEIMIHTVLPKIFVKEWDTDYERILRMFKIEKHKAETFIICPRRYGKTVSVAMFCAAYLYMVQDASIAIFSTSKRTSGKMMTAIYGFMRELPFYKSTSFDIKNSEQIKITVYGNERSIWSYPGTVAPSEVEVPIHEAFLTPIFTTPEEEHLTEKEVTLTVPTIIIIQAAAAAETTKEEEQVLEKKEDVIVVSKPLDESESDLKEISGRKPSPLSSRSPPLSSTIPPSLTGQSYSFSTENHKKALQHLYQEDINEGPLGFKTKTRSDVLIDRALSLRYGLLRPVRTDPIYAKYGLTYEDECVWFERKNIGGDEINSFFHCILAYVGRWHPMYAESNMRNGLNLRTALVDELLNMCFGIDKESVVALLVWAKSNQTVGGRDVHAVHADPAVGSTSVAIKEKRDLVADIKRKQKRSTEVLVKKFRDHCASSPFPFVNNTIVQQKQRQQQYHDVSLKKHPTLVQNGSTSVDPQQQPTLSSICYKPCEIDNPWGFLSILGDSAYKKKMANILATLWFYSEFRIISKDNYSYGTANFVLNMLEHILDLYIPEKSIDVNIMMRLYCERKGVSIFIYGIDIKNQGLRPIAKYVPTYRNASVGCNIYLIYYQGRYDLLGPVLSQTHKSQQLRYNVELRKRGTVMPHHPIPLTTTTEELLRVQTQMRGATTIVTAAIRLGSKQTKVSQEILKKAILIETDDVTLIRNEVDDVVDAGTAAHKSRPIMPTAEPAPISSSRKRIDLSCFNLDGLSFREAVMRFFSLAPKRVDVDLVADASGGDDDDDNNNDDYADDSEHVDRGEHDELSVKSSSSSMVGDLFRSAFGAKKQSPSDSKHHARIGVQNYNTNSSTVACVYDVGFDKVTVDDTTYCVYSKDRNIASLKQRMKGPFLKSSDVGRPGPFHKCSSSELSWSRSVIRIVNLGHLLDIKTQSREATSSMALNNSIHEEGESCRKDSFFLGSTFLSIKVTRNDNLQANILEPIAGFSSKLGECVEVLNDRIRSSFILVLIEELRKEFFPQQQKSSKQQQKQQKTDAGEKKENARQIDCNDRVSRIWSQFGLSKNKAAIAITPGQSDGGGGDESSAQSVDDIFYNDDRADWNEETKCHRIIHSIDSVSFKSVPCEKRTLHHLADVQTKRLSPVEALGFINRTTISYLDLNTFRVSGVGIMDDKRYSASSRNPFLRYHSTTWQNPFEGSANHQRGAHVNSIFPSFYGTFDALSSDGVGGSSSHLRLSQSQQKFNINLSFHLPKCCSGVVIYSRTPIIQMDARRKSTVAYRTVQSQYNHQKQHSAARDVPSAEMLAHLMCLNERREKDQDELWKLTLGQYLRQRKTGGSTDAASAIKIVGYKESGSIEALLATVEASPIEMNSLFDLQDPQSFRLVGYIYVLVTYDVDPIMYSTLLDTQSATRATSANASGSSNSLNVNDVCRHVNVKTKSFYANCIKAFNS